MGLLKDLGLFRWLNLICISNDAWYPINWSDSPPLQTDYDSFMMCQSATLLKSRAGLIFKEKQNLFWHCQLWKTGFTARWVAHPWLLRCPFSAVTCRKDKRPRSLASWSGFRSLSWSYDRKWIVTQNSTTQQWPIETRISSSSNQSETGFYISHHFPIALSWLKNRRFSLL